MKEERGEAQRVRTFFKNPLTASDLPPFMFKFSLSPSVP
jgi:hypothetical protein